MKTIDEVNIRMDEVVEECKAEWQSVPKAMDLPAFIAQKKN